MRNGNGVSSLCTRCSFRVWTKVKDEDGGTIVDRCNRLNLNLRKLPSIRDCKAFDAEEAPWIFGSEAWVMYKDNAGNWTFTPPRGEE